MRVFLPAYFLPLCVFCFSGFLFVPRAEANTSKGHIAICIALLIDATENPGNYSTMHRLTENKLLLKPPTKDGYDFAYDSLKPEQRAFFLGSIAPDDVFFSPDVDGWYFSESWHYINSIGRINSIFKQAEEEEDPQKRSILYAYGFGALTHVKSDLIIHPRNDIPDVREKQINWPLHIIRESIADKWLIKGVLQTYRVVNAFDGEPDASSMTPNTIADRLVFSSGLMRNPSLIEGYHVHCETDRYYETVFLKCVHDKDPACPCKDEECEQCALRKVLTQEMIEHLKRTKTGEPPWLNTLMNQGMLAARLGFDAMEMLDFFGRIIGIPKKWITSILKAPFEPFFQFFDDLIAPIQKIFHEHILKIVTELTGAPKIPLKEYNDGKSKRFEQRFPDGEF